MKNVQYTDHKIIDGIINDVKTCHVGMVDGDKPYVVPFNFGYENNTLYIHCAPSGRKLDVLRKNPNVCVSFETEAELYVVDEPVACSYSMTFKSVILMGKVEFITDFDEKIKIMNIIMKHYTGKDDFKYNTPSINNVIVMKISPEKVTARIRN